MKIPTGVLSDFPMLPIIHMFAILNYTQNTALSNTQIFKMYVLKFAQFSQIQ